MGSIITPPKMGARWWPQFVDSGSKPVLPTSFPGLQFWYRGDSANPAGGNLTSWTDKSTQGRNLTILSASKPVVVPNTLNGKTVVHFTSTLSQDARCNQGATIVGTAGYTVFIVKRNPAVGLQQSHFAVDCGSGACISIGHEMPGDKFEVRYVPLFAAGGSPDTTNSFVIERVRQVPAGNVGFWVNGNQVINGSTLSPAVATSPQICLGSAGIFGEYFEGDIAEVFLYVPALSLADCEKLEGLYLEPYYDIGPFGPNEIASMVSSNALAALWDTGVPSSVVLAGAFAATVKDITGNGIDVSQVVPNQPQYTGAPLLGTWQSLLFSAPLANRLVRLNTSLITTPNIGTLIWASAFPAAGGQFQLSHTNEATFTDGITMGAATDLNHFIQSPRSGGLALGHSSSTNNPVVNVPDVFVWVVDGISSTFYINGVVTPNTSSNNPQLIPTAPTDTLTIGAILASGSGAESFNWCFGAWFNSALSPALITSITKRLMGRLGIFDIGLVADLWLRGGTWILDGSNNVTSWTDQSGHGFHATIASGGPNGALATLNGHPGARGNGSTARLNLTGPIMGTRNTLCLVTTPTNSLAAIWSWITQCEFVQGVGGSLAVNWINASDNINMTPASTTGSHIFTVTQIDGSNITGYVDGLQVFSGVPASPLNTKTFASLFCRDTGDIFFNGDIFEVIHSPVVSAIQTKNLNDALQEYYGLGPFTSREIADMVAVNGLVAMYDTAILSSVVLNGNDVSSLIDLTGLGRTVAQVSAANQPQYLGTTPVNNWRPIALTGANNDGLSFAANVIGAGPATIVMVARPANTATIQFLFGNVGATGVQADSGWCFGTFTPVRVSWLPGVTTPSTPGGPSLTVPEVWVGRNRTAPANSRLMINGVDQTLTTPTAVRLSPVGGQIAIGSAPGTTTNYPFTGDFFFAMIFTTEISDALALSITNRLKARLNIP